ncbi:MAG: WYL domain-containing protein [Cytophagales bacterium]|nr:WYL domain-containing protein [Cytophagales bacterium]
MSTREQLLRYLLIVRKLRQSKRTSAKDLFRFLRDESELQGYDFDISVRTLQRNFKDIESIFGIVIKCDRSTQQYYIYEDSLDDMNNRLLETFDLIYALNVAEKKTPYLILEKRADAGTEYMHGLIYAIQNQKIITISHLKFFEDTPTVRELQPYALKEFKGRWYIFAVETNTKAIKNFGLDRIKKLDISNKKFSKNTDIDAEIYYKDCFGIINPENQPPEKIVLWFDRSQAGYLETLPLHHSQKFEQVADNYIIVTYFMKITYDLEREILSYGHHAKVLEPAWWRDVLYGNGVY